jgi:competence protein ComEA
VSRSDRILVASGGIAAVLALAAAFVLLMPAEGAVAPPSASTLALVGPSDVAAPSVAAGGSIVVDVEGAVAKPGIRTLPAGSRIADAIDAAGGYATDADLSAAASINLAEPVTDGQQIRVPVIGDTVVAGPGPSSAMTAGNGAAGGLVNLNTATPEELEALPGIGAVTVQKIVAARQERPFASLQDAVDRGVIDRGQLEDISGVATAG